MELISDIERFGNGSSLSKQGEVVRFFKPRFAYTDHVNHLRFLNLTTGCYLERRNGSLRVPGSLKGLGTAHLAEREINRFR